MGKTMLRVQIFTQYSVKQNSGRLPVFGSFLPCGIFVMVTDLTCLIRSVAFRHSRVDKGHRRAISRGDMSGLMEMVSGNRDFYRNEQLIFHWLAAAGLRALLVDSHPIIPRRDELQVNLDLRETLAAAALAAPDFKQGDVRDLDLLLEFDFPAALVLEGARVACSRSLRWTALFHFQRLPLATPCPGQFQRSLSPLGISAVLAWRVKV